MNDITKVIAAHRAVADLLEAHPDLPCPTVSDLGDVLWFFYSWDNHGAEDIAAIRRAVGGTWDKRESADGETFHFEREGYHIQVSREKVCTRRVVGTRTKVLPAVEAQPERTVEEDIVEWDCAPILEAVSA